MSLYELVHFEGYVFISFSVPWWTSKRLCLSIVCFCGFFCLYAQRVNLSIAIVCMVKHGHSTNNGQTLDNSSSIYNISSNFTSNGTIYTHSEDETSTVIIRSTIKQCPVALSTSTLVSTSTKSLKCHQIEALKLFRGNSVDIFVSEYRCKMYLLRTCM